MKKAIIYYRVSTEDQARHGISLEQQKNNCFSYAQQKEIEIIKSFHDDGVSAKTANRPGLQDMLNYCTQNYKQIDYVIIYKIDRLSRNVEDYSSISILLSKLDIQLVSTTESIDKTPAGKFMGNIMAVVAQLDNDTRSERVSICMKERLKSGVWCWKAPLGYLNGRDKQGVKTIDVDDKKLKLIKWAFEEFAKGIYTLKEIREKLNKKGLRTESGKEISFQFMSKMIGNTFYYGMMYSPKNNEYWPGTHKVIIDENTFYKCQEILARKNGKAVYKTKRKKSKDFPLRNFVLCKYCSRPLTASYSTGRHGGKFPYYRCYNKDCGKLCSIAKSKLEDDFVEYIKDIVPKEEFFDSFEAVIKDVWEKKYTELNSDNNVAQKSIEKLSEEKAGLIKMKTRELLDDEDFKVAMEEIKIKIMKLQNQCNESKLENFDVKQVTNEVFNKIKTLPELWIKSQYEQKRQIQGLIFIEKPTYDKITFETPQLSLLLAKNKEPAHADSSLVVRRRIELRLPG